MRVVTAAQMRAADAAAVARVGDTALMRAAGEALAAAIAAVAPEARKIVAFAGPGNNGGDAYAALAALRGESDRYVYALPADHASDGRRDAQTRARAAGVVSRPFPVSVEEACTALAGADLAIDALLGVGSRTDVSGRMAAVVEALARSGVPVLAVDVPTGTDSDTGEVGPLAVRAAATVALGAAKLGLLLEPARGLVGTLYVGDIGIDAELEAARGERYRAMDDAEMLALLPRRGEESDKRESGAPLVVAGSARYPGAAVLCARGAARAGAGYVTVASERAAGPALQSHLLEQVVVAYDDGETVESAIGALVAQTRSSTAIAIGPGMDASDRTGEIVRGFLARTDLPFVADASALRHLAGHLEPLRGKRCVLTPHEKEFAAIDGGGPIAPGERSSRLRAFVARTGITTLLKGNATLVDDGTTVHLNVTGTNALATAGTGDVLSGIVGTLLAQGLEPVDAARLGAYWHGLAGRHAQAERRVGVTAGDVAEALGYAVPHAPSRRRSPLRVLVR